MDVNFSLDIEACLKALAKTGKFGNTPEEVVEHLIQYKVFLLDDVKRFTIAGLLQQGTDEGWIKRNLPGSEYKNKRALDNVKKDWSSYSTEKLSEKSANESEENPA